MDAAASVYQWHVHPIERKVQQMCLKGEPFGLHNAYQVMAMFKLLNVLWIYHEDKAWNLQKPLTNFFDSLDSISSLGQNWNQFQKEVQPTLAQHTEAKAWQNGRQSRTTMNTGGASHLFAYPSAGWWTLRISIA